MATIQELESEIKKINYRNDRIESDKKWETSYFRSFCIAIGTYFLCLILLLTIGAQNPFLGAIVPMVGYLLSTLSLGFLKNLWQKQN